MIEGVEELGAEYQGLSLRDSGRLHDGDVPVELTGAEDNANARVAISGSVTVNASGWSGAKGAVVEVARTTAIAAQTLRKTAARQNGAVGLSGAQLRCI